MNLDTILTLLDEKARIQAFQACLTKLQTTHPLDLEALQVCMKLQPTVEHAPQSGISNERTLSDRVPDIPAAGSLSEDSPVDKLHELLVMRIPDEQLDSDHFYKLAGILCSDARFAISFFKQRIYPRLVSLLEDVSERAQRDAEKSNEAEEALRQAIRITTSYLTLLKCSYWLPSRNSHVVDPDTLQFLSRFLGLSAIDDAAHDVLSAFLSLLKRKESIVVATANESPQPWLKFDSESGQAILSASLMDSSLWDTMSMLDYKNISPNKATSKIYRTWFQWISQIAVDRVQLNCLNGSSYWDKIRGGLLYGHTDQRRYCIGIIRQSLLAAQCDISTPAMRFRLFEKDAYLKTYDQFSSLFETIVLDRYANQVQACLPELTKLMHTHITPAMMSTLLSAALNPMVQDGVRKLIGNWYIQYVTKLHGDVSGHTDFLFEWFLPWATQGDLFTSTLIATRDTTTSTHGASLADVIARFVLVFSNTPHSVDRFSPDACAEPSEETRHTILFRVIDFILDARGRIFHFSILYLLEGLVEGLRTCADTLPSNSSLTPTEIDKISRVSRLPGLPEIAGDLYKEYCIQICDMICPDWMELDEPNFRHIQSEVQRLKASMGSEPTVDGIGMTSQQLPRLQDLRKQLKNTNHRSIQGDGYASMCKTFIKVLDATDIASVNDVDLHFILEALWEEADRRQFVRSVAVHLPSVLFHPVCVQVCIGAQRCRTDEATMEGDLRTLLIKAMDHLQQLSEGRIYILATLVTAVRRSVLLFPDLIAALPLEDFILQFINHPPTIKSEFLFEVAAAEKLQQYQPQRTYDAYYGSREWHAYAAIIDLLARFPPEHSSFVKRVLDRLLEPWKLQRPGVPIISKWKNVLQLQAMLLLVDYCVEQSEADRYLVSFKHALTLEPWPRYRFLLEWIIARICYRVPGKAPQILQDLSVLDDSSSTHIASLMKLAVLVAPRESEDFSATFMEHLVPFAASPRVQIRHESNYAIPIIFNLARTKGWKSITHNPAFVRLDTFIRTLDKYQSTPWTIRTLKLDAVNDFSLVNVFEGQYLTIESPEKARVAYEDFVALHEVDHASGLMVPPERIRLGERTHTDLIVPTQTPATKTQQVLSAADQASPFQTKSGLDINSLHPQSGPPSLQNQRPASVILVASLIDNPTNLGGLSRISESFGLEALYIDDLKQKAHKDFKATSVTSEKHFPIHQLKLAAVPEFLLNMKTSGYEVVGIEQTDQSSILGTEDEEDSNAHRQGILPKKCVLVLGSEKGGISAEVLAAVDRCVEIRTVGVTRSLNVQTAGGIAVYEWWRKWYEKAQ
ncbi:hypothetical protein DE146DRAFT_739893 [Phaeosphaeria sp. MPI-PUGE-AT-0046c]|nr:hypothetical protein DE146DRAFT_739893 [Phaeosphaeria sp. MPI-PUGE-AT-0046c]